MGSGHAHGIPQRTAEAGELNDHHIAVLEPNAVSEAQAVRAVVMHVNIARPPVRLELEMMMLDVREAVAHLSLASGNVTRPNRAAEPLDADATRHSIEIAVDDQLGSERTLRSFEPARFR